MSTIMIRDVPVKIDHPVDSWGGTGLHFPGLGRRTETRAVGIHWTGGRGHAEQVYDTLQQRKLSVQFCIDIDGTIYQFCDASDRAEHIGTANGWCVGIEICNPADGQDNSRETYREVIHGRAFRCSYFHPVQVIAARKLTQTLCTAYGLPFQAPMASTVVPDLSTFRGVLGHFHVTRRKPDPGVRILRAIGA